MIKYCQYCGSFNTKRYGKTGKKQTKISFQSLRQSFYSMVKSDYRRHRGLTQMRKIHYLKWYCYLKNSNTF